MRRPFADLSMSGPSKGETTAKGAMVSRRYYSTLLLASSGETEKNNEPASETVTMVSPAIMITCTNASRPKAVFWSKRSCAAARAREANPRRRTGKA